MYVCSWPREGGHFAEMCDFLGFLQISPLIYKIYAIPRYQSIALYVGFLWDTLSLQLDAYIESYGLFPGLN